ncbi:MAG: hypothetical protein LLG02_09495 [Pelosinus sp.]|nr:hypothetical protein [Pelosinus sp.]
MPKAINHASDQYFQILGLFVYGHVNVLDKPMIKQRHQSISRYIDLLPSYKLQEDLDNQVRCARFTLKKSIQIQNLEDLGMQLTHVLPNNKLSLFAIKFPEKEQVIIFDASLVNDKYCFEQYQFKEISSCGKIIIPRIPLNREKGIDLINKSLVTKGDVEDMQVQAKNGYVFIEAIRFYRKNITKREIVALSVLLSKTEPIHHIDVACIPNTGLFQVTYWFEHKHSCSEDYFYLWLSYFESELPQDFSVVIRTQEGLTQVFNYLAHVQSDKYVPIELSEIN